jgi:multidrug efflux pump subunit AcrB
VAAKGIMDRVPEVRNARVGRDDGRPELALQIDRPKAALLGLSVNSVASNIRTSVGGTQAAFFRQGGNEYPIVVGYAKRIASGSKISTTFSSTRRKVKSCKRKTCWHCAISPARPRFSARTRNAYFASRRSRK